MRTHKREQNSYKGPHSGPIGGSRRSPQGDTALPVKAGHNRFLWDLRYPGAWSPDAPNDDGEGPLVPPGRYRVRLTVGGWTDTQPLDIEIDPRVEASGVTQTDLVEQTMFLLRVRDAISDARKLQQRLEQAMDAAGVKPPPPPAPGETPGTVTYDSPLQSLWARLVSAEGPYPQPMLISQLANIRRMLSQADQKVGQDAYQRFDDVMKALKAVQAEAAKLMGA